MQMQDLQSSINGAGVVPGKLLLRQPQQLTVINNTFLNHHPLSQHQQQHQHQQQQQVALKCPRCDSSNTKFCYYNNYNLSQPRHFCKNCRRYWTKGGVLRNVPVGGGCRKSKRSSKPKSPSSHSTTTSSAATTTAIRSSTGGAAAAGGGQGGNSMYCSQDHGINSSNSSSESSATAVGGGGGGCCGGGGGGLFQIPEMDNLETLVDSSSNNNSNLFSDDDIGNYMSLNDNNNNKCDNMININNNNNNININDEDDNGNSSVVGGGAAAVAEAASFSEFLRNQEWEMGKIICGAHHQEEQAKIIGGSTSVDDLVDVIDQTVRIEDFLQNRGTNVGISTLDWHLTDGNNQGLFDDVGDNSTVDQRDYWGQSTTAVNHHHNHDPQWSDSTTGHLPLFLP